MTWAYLAAELLRYIAVGSTDALVSLWDLQEWFCVRTFTKSECVELIASRVPSIWSFLMVCFTTSQPDHRYEALASLRTPSTWPSVEKITTSIS